MNEKHEQRLMYLKYFKLFALKMRTQHNECAIILFSGMQKQVAPYSDVWLD